MRPRSSAIWPTGRERTSAAYELGRNAVSDPIGLLNLVHVHHEVLVDVLRTAAYPEEVQDIGMPRRRS
jgi:hypothetical protein